MPSDNNRKMREWPSLGQYGGMTTLRHALAALVIVLAAPLVADARARPAEGIDALRLSAELARQGRQRHDPWLLATAARLRRETPVQASPRTPEAAPGDSAPFDPAAAWLDEAERMGAADPRLMSLVAEVRAFAFRGRTGGPKVSTARLGAGGVHRYGESFDPSQPAVVYVEGDGDSDLLLTVRDAAGGQACAEMGPGDIKICSWTPRASGAYRIEITNRGVVDDRYAVATN